MQMIVCKKPIIIPTKLYPKINLYDFIGEEYSLFRKNVCLSLETVIASVNMTKEYENTIIAGSNELISNIGV